MFSHLALYLLEAPGGSSTLPLESDAFRTCDISWKSWGHPRTMYAHNLSHRLNFTCRDTPCQQCFGGGCACHDPAGARALAHRQCGPTTTCHICDTRGHALESLEHHAVRCPAGEARAFMHARLISTLQKVLQEAGVPTSATVTEARGLRGGVNMTRPGDIVVLDTAPGRHLLLDGVVTTVYRNTRQRETGVIPGYAAKLVEDRKF